ncbi:hypothetical protein COT77_01090 [Candidatus Berkelbacteria bacterium CG10_big_fil_rev_8_21_14_0_10_41_12]|uniref:DNA replication and repair protein RecF n=1 Tax=Candidatus Berkelbacteria bacterium CG10_big_fil_rev_8_21_14_0_10_41_12 TaxID=1974513 RepID=A0A2M6WXP5_9BACT|nr:MAG: hypothetical protein COT77_01090 [Candidatus Berkelbacteria bacterium CG10_big_fil_rev_8_21_14_0_10_41_12]
MLVLNLKLRNIRIFEKKEIGFDQGANLIVGPNGSGKTTIIESIALFGFGQLQSVKNDFWAVSRGEDVGRIELESDFSDASVAILEGKKIIKIKDNKQPLSELIGYLKMISFNPETIDLVKGAPSRRRSELDQVICFKDKKFVLDLLAYKKILRQRNGLLKMINRNRARREDLGFWNKKIASFGEKIFLKRCELINYINTALSTTHTGLVGAKSSLEISYRPSTPYDDLLAEISNSMEKDIATASTQIGPHRDDFTFIQGEFDLAQGASRGEQRVATIAFKIETKKYLTTEEGEPIVLLDDVFSELDEKRKDSIRQIIGSGQVVISATDKSSVPGEILRRAKIIELK